MTAVILSLPNPLVGKVYSKLPVPLTLYTVPKIPDKTESPTDTMDVEIPLLFEKLLILILQRLSSFFFVGIVELSLVNLFVVL